MVDFDSDFGEDNFTSKISNSQDRDWNKEFDQLFAKAP